MSFWSEVHLKRIWVITCGRCNENIVERSDDDLIVTRQDAETYAREHWDTEHAESDR